MDLPVKIEVPKISHYALLKIVLPVIPGAVTAIGIMLGGSFSLRALLSSGFGYKTSVAIAALLAYIVGMALMQTVEVAFVVVFGLFKNQKGILVPTDRYWRQLVSEYLGEKLIPRSSPPEDLDSVISYMSGAGLLNKKGKALLADKQNAVNQIAETLRVGSETLAGVNDTQKKLELEIQLAGLRGRIDSARAESAVNLQAAISLHQWSQLHVALSWLSPVEDPYIGFDVLMLSIQSASIALLILITCYPAERNLGIALFASAVAVASTFTRWQVYFLNIAYAPYNPKAIASLLKALKQSVDQ